jgi:PAS domain S-box-containing protein/putative nucleotidyltransferase with HDIG domain
LRESEERYRRIVETASEGVWVADESYRTSFANAQMADMLRCSVESLVGRPIQEFIFPEDLPQFAKMLPDAFFEGQRAEQRLRRADGSELWVLISAAPVVDASGCFRGASALISDITEQRLSAEQLAAGAVRLQRTVEGAVAAMGSAVEMRDPYTAGHQRRVTRLAEAIAHELGLDEDVVQGLRLASQVHDVGKIAVPAEILSKPGRLHSYEYQLVQAHSRVGHDILQSIAFDRPVAEIVLQHHERIDGSGYPLGLANGDILIEARIVSVADTVEAMASHRPYRPALGLDKALEEIRDGRGTRYDVDVVDACLKVCGSAGFSFGI